MNYDEIKNEILKNLYFEGKIQVEEKYIEAYLYCDVLNLDEEKDENEVEKELFEFKEIYSRLLKENIIKVEKTDDNRTLIKYGHRKPMLLNELIETGSLELKDAFNYTNVKEEEIKREIQGKIDKLDALYEKMNEKTEEMAKLVNEQEDKVKNFYYKILEILGILIAVFSIIGFNIQGVGSIIDSANKASVWSYVGGIGVINICIVLSIYLLFYLINRVINKGEKAQGILSEKAFWILLLIFVIIILTCFMVSIMQLFRTSTI